jgi:hypothetical protein
VMETSGGASLQFTHLGAGRENEPDRTTGSREWGRKGELSDLWRSGGSLTRGYCRGLRSFGSAKQ